MFVKAPGFTAIAILSIACGTGANVAMFSVADALLLRPMAVPRPSEVLTIGIRRPLLNGFSTPLLLSYPDYVDLRTRSHSFEGLAGSLLRRAGISTAPGAAIRVRIVSLVTANYFDVMHVTPQIGRAFVAADDQIGGRPAAILSHDLWQASYAGDPHVVGRTIRVAGIDCVIVGVAPQSFTGTSRMVFPDLVYLPLSVAPQLNDRLIADLLTDRDLREMTVQGRLQRGVSIEQARAELATLGDALAAFYPRSGDHAVQVRTELAERFAANPIDLGLVILLTTLSSGVLIVACANVAGLLASRAPLRAREISLKLAIGAGRGRLIRQLVTESLLLSLGGGIGGLAIGRAGLVLLRQMRFPSDFIKPPALELDMRALAFTLIVAIASAFVFGLWPAVYTTRVHLSAGARELEDRPARWRLTPRAQLVAVQVALSLALVTVAAFTVQIFTRLSTTGPGFRTTQIAKVDVDTAYRQYSDDQAAAFFAKAVTAARELPTVTHATVTSMMPFWMSDFAAIRPEGAPVSRDETTTPLAASVDEDYFSTLDIPVLRGRAFTANDDENAPHVAIVNETLARRRWPGRDAIGKRFRVEPAGPWIEVIGIARDSKYLFMVEKPQEAIYFPFRQRPSASMVVLAQTNGDSASLVAPLRGVITRLDPDMPAYDAQTMEAFYDARAVGLVGVVMKLVTGIGLMGTSLTMIGLYSLVAFAVARRTREIGIRMAIGATTTDIVALFLRQGMRPAWVGLPLGLVLSGVIVRVLPALVLSTDRLDVRFYAVVVPAVTGLVMLAAFIPARRAARVNPMVALRYD
jgi:predicted permease